MNKKTQENAPLEGTVTSTDMVELKRDMQHAKVTEWLENNQQSLIATAITLVLLLVGFSLWQEQQRSQKESAALVYMKATSLTDEAQRAALLSSVSQDYADTGYALLATLQQGNDADDALKQVALTSLIQHQTAPEIAAQARLDLAELYIHQGNTAEANQLLQVRLGKHYEQARYALLAAITEDSTEKVAWLQKALAATSNDNDLRAALETKLGLLQAAQ